MEWFENITNILSLLFGGSVISIVTWRFTRRKAEAEAKKAEAEAQQEKQNYYQQLVTDIASDRDYYKQDRDEQRERLDKLTRSMTEWKRITDETIDDLRRQVSRNGRQLEAIRPFICADLKCKKRVRVVVSAEGVVEEPKPEPRDIEPVEQEAI